MEKKPKVRKTEVHAVVGVLWTVEEAAEALRVKPEWLYGRIHYKNLPFPYLKVGRYTRFPAEGIRKYIESQLRDGSAA